MISSDLNGLISERERMLEEVEKSSSYVSELNQLSSQVPDCAPAALQAVFSRDNTPLAELVSVLPVLRGELENIQKLGAQMAACRSEIEQIQKRDRTIIIAGIGIVILLIIILIAKISS